MFKARAIRGRWYGLAGDSGHSVHLVSVQVVTPSGMLTHRVVRARNIRFMDAAQEPDADFDAGVAPAESLAADDPALEAMYDVQGRQYYDGEHPDICTVCKTEGLLYLCDYCPTSYCFPHSDATALQLTTTWRCPQCRARDVAAPQGQEVDEPTPPPPTGPAPRWGVGMPPVTESSDKDEALPTDSNLSDLQSALSDRMRERLRRHRAHARLATLRDRANILKAAAHANDVHARTTRAAVRKAAADAMPAGSGSEDEGDDEGPSAYLSLIHI